MKTERFFLFRREREDFEGYYYIQRLISPSVDGALSNTSKPEYAWRGKTALEVEEMKFLISISEYEEFDWEIVEYDMSPQPTSWAKPPDGSIFLNLFRELPALSKQEEEQLEIFKSNHIIKNGKK